MAPSTLAIKRLAGNQGWGARATPPRCAFGGIGIPALGDTQELDAVAQLFGVFDVLPQPVW
jgi:hypothetical protein